MSEKRRRWVPEDSSEYSNFLNELQDNRTTDKIKNKRKPLSRKDRESIFLKTDGRCHICGGTIEDKWDADHILPHSAGGEHSVDNYLPAHNVCNNYRWFYSPEEFQEIMRLGIWLRTRIVNGNQQAMDAASDFIKYEKDRIKRRKNDT